MQSRNTETMAIRQDRLDELEVKPDRLENRSVQYLIAARQSRKLRLYEMITPLFCCCFKTNSSRNLNEEFERFNEILPEETVVHSNRYEPSNSSRL